MIDFVDRCCWWLMKRLFTVHRVGTVDFIDLRIQRDPDTRVLLQALADAFERINASGKEFAGLVAGHLHLIAAMGFRRWRVSPRVGGYFSRFDAKECENSHYLACRLIWGAAFIKHFNDARRAGGSIENATIRHLAAETQLAFVRMFPDAVTWEDYLARHTS